MQLISNPKYLAQHFILYEYFYCKRVNTIETLQVPVQKEPLLVPPVKIKLQAPLANPPTSKVSVKLQ